MLVMLVEAGLWGCLVEVGRLGAGLEWGSFRVLWLWVRTAVGASSGYVEKHLFSSSCVSILDCPELLWQVESLRAQF